MKLYHILKDFKGTQDGFGEGEQFVAGTTAPLSDWLAAVAVPAGQANPMEPDVLIDGPHPVLIEEPDAEPVLVEGVEADDRETKVIVPEEAKPAKPLIKMSKAELVAHALAVHNLELAPDNLTAKQMIEAIEAAGKA